MILDNLIFPFDYIILTLIFIILVICFFKGFIQSILSLLTWLGSILITIYTYNSLANFLTKQILNIKFLQKYEYLSTIISLIISIPIIFLISLFILKKIRMLISADIDKKILGIIFDKIFGLLYGIFFSYIIFTTIIVLLHRYDFIFLDDWLKQNSYIFFNIDKFNQSYIYIINDIKNIKE